MSDDIRDVTLGCGCASGGCLIAAVIIALALGVGAMIVKFFWNLV